MQIKRFYEFINESRKTRSALIEIEFDWTWADQMSEQDARKRLEEELFTVSANGEYTDLPAGSYIDEDTIQLYGWDEEDETDEYEEDEEDTESEYYYTPDYGKQYTAEFEVEFTCEISEIEKWANDLSHPIYFSAIEISFV